LKQKVAITGGGEEIGRLYVWCVGELLIKVNR